MTAVTGLAGQSYDVHAELRRATEQTHLALHDLPRFRAIAEGRLDRAAYADLLCSLHGFHSAIAGAARRGGLSHLSCSEARLDRLEADLDVLGRRPPKAADSFIPISSAGLYGALYVAEGSALGGRVIARQLDYLFGEALPGRTFFTGDSAIGSAWRQFLAAMRSAWPDHNDLGTLVAGAQAAFALFLARVER